MTARATERAAAGPTGGARAPRPGARQLLVRFLTLREGSIIVVTILAGLGLVLCLICALLVSAVVGIVNGVITEVFGVSSFITTLGMLLGLGGLTLIISHAAPVAMPGAEVTSHTIQVTHVVNGAKVTLPEKVNEVGTFANIFGAGKYSELIWALIIVGAVQVLLSLTRWGMYTVSVGGN